MGKIFSKKKENCICNKMSIRMDPKSAIKFAISEQGALKAKEILKIVKKTGVWREANEQILIKFLHELVRDDQELYREWSEEHKAWFYDFNN